MMVAESVAVCNSFLCDYMSVQFDPAHLLAELGFTIVFELLQLLVVVVLWKKVVKPRLIKSTHEEIDRQHNVEHDTIE